MGFKVEGVGFRGLAETAAGIVAENMNVCRYLNSTFPAFRCGFQVLGFWVLGSGFWILGFGFWGLSWGFRIEYSRLRVWGLEFGVSSCVFRARGLENLGSRA